MKNIYTGCLDSAGLPGPQSVLRSAVAEITLNTTIFGCWPGHLDDRLPLPTLSNSRLEEAMSVINNPEAVIAYSLHVDRLNAVCNAINESLMRGNDELLTTLSSRLMGEMSTSVLPLARTALQTVYGSASEGEEKPGGQPQPGGSGRP